MQPLNGLMNYGILFCYNQLNDTNSFVYSGISKLLDGSEDD